VRAVGADVTGLAVGDRVYFSGTAGATLAGSYAELAVCAAPRVYPLPEAISFAQGAAVGVPYATAFRALFHKARAVRGESVLVHGASGGVGMAAVQLSVALGLTVFGTASTDRGRELVRAQGAHQVLDHSSADYMAKVMDQTGGRGVDIVLESLANVNLGKDLEVVARFGRIVVIGSRGPVEVNLRRAMTKDATIHGLALANATEAEIASIHAGIGAGLANGSLRPVVGQELPLRDAARAHEAVLAGGALGKVVLVP
jgi:NADPH2:quinone reductase